MTLLGTLWLPAYGVYYIENTPYADLHVAGVSAYK